MKKEHAEGFGPVYDAESKVLILGSFPSVKSRAVGFYYGNRQNRFWHTMSAFFHEEGLPCQGTEEKIAFLHRHHVALWDVVESCDIVGSSDLSIENEKVADIPSVLRESRVGAIFCNGAKSYELLGRRFPELLPMAKLLPSTSPANPRFSRERWFEALSLIFPHVHTVT